METDRLNQTYQLIKQDLEQDALRLKWTPEELDAMAKVCAIDEVIGDDKAGHADEIALRREIMETGDFITGFYKLGVSLRAGLKRLDS